MKITVDETKLKYRYKEGSWLKNSWLLFRVWVQRIVLVTPINPPFDYYGLRRLLGGPTFDELGNSISFNKKLLPSINAHKERAVFYWIINSSLYIAFTILALLFLSIGLAFFVIVFDNKNAVENNSWFIILISEFLIAGLSLRIANTIVDKSFPDTLAAFTGIYLLLILQQNRPITEPTYKRLILERIRALRRNIILLSKSFMDRSFESDTRTENIFKNMELFVREKERWVIAPKEGTKQDLLNDLNSFVEILITGEYGNLEQKNSETSETIAQPEMQKHPKNFGEMLVRFLLSIFPFLLLVVLYFSPERITAIGLDTNTIFLVSLAWILLVIDANLKLGIVDRVASLARTMKEVSKL